MSVNNKSCRNFLMLLAFPGLLCGTAPAYSDATLVYQTVNADGAKSQHTFSISGRFVRVEADTTPDRFQVIDTGMMTMADVDRATMRYTFEKLPMGYPPAALPADRRPASASPMEQARNKAGEATVKPDAMLSATPELSPTRKKQNVSGVLCRVVRELVDGQPVAEHCMAGTGPLGLTSREMITLSRLFILARRMELGWPGVSTADERIASVDSRVNDGAASQTLLSVTYDYIPDDQMRVTKQYKRVKSLTAEPEKAGGKTQAAGNEKPAAAGP